MLSKGWVTTSQLKMPPSSAREEENASKPAPPPSPQPINTNHRGDLLREETREEKGPVWHFVPAEDLFIKMWFMSEVTIHPQCDFSAVLPSPVWARLLFSWSRNSGWDGIPLNFSPGMRRITLLWESQAISRAQRGTPMWKTRFTFLVYFKRWI